MYIFKPLHLVSNNNLFDKTVKYLINHYVIVGNLFVSAGDEDLLVAFVLGYVEAGLN